MRRGLVIAVLVFATLAGMPAAASAADNGTQVYLSLNDGWWYPQGADVDFGFVCVGPWVVSCEGSQPMGSKLDTFHAGSHTVSATATDYDGTVTTATATYNVFDITKPHVVFRTPSEGAELEQGAFATVDYSCEDDPGGLGIIEGGCSGPPIGMPIDTSHVGTFSFSVFAVDRQLNIAQESVHYSVVDRTPPTIEIRAPAADATYTLGQPAVVDFGCDDRGGSGISTCKGQAPWGSALDTATLGTKTFTVNATDRAGNAARETHTYTVIYDFTGFASPSAAFPTATAMKAGEAVPLKFSLRGDQGTDIFAAGSPGWAPCGALDGPSRADGALSYNASGDRYTYMWSTSKSWAGGCRDLIMVLRDGTTHKARFTFK